MMREHFIKVAHLPAISRVKKMLATTNFNKFKTECFFLVKII